MKFTTSVVSSLMATAAVARPRAAEEGPLPEKSRITAFVMDHNGNPSIECWELNSIVESMQTQRKDGSKATSRMWSLSNSAGLEGVDILTWPSYSPIWPPPNDDVKKSTAGGGFDLAASFNLFNVQGGLVDFRVNFGFFAKSDDDDEQETHIFSLENGDDWFYFEDNTNNARFRKADAAPFLINTISGSETELLRLRYGGQPRHRVVHKGACSFTGITALDKPAVETTSRAHSPLSVQVNIEDL